MDGGDPLDDEMFARLWENIEDGAQQADERDAIWVQLLSEDVAGFGKACNFRWKLLVNEHNWRCRVFHFSRN